MENTRNATVAESVVSPMNTKLAKTLALCLASLMLICSLASCGETQGKNVQYVVVLGITRKKLVFFVMALVMRINVSLSH